MRISVVIPAYRARDVLELCLLSLARQSLEAQHSSEVIVVDDGSADGTDRMVAGLPSGLDLRYVYAPRSAASGRARARNLGLARAAGDLVVLLDADQVVAPTFLAEHARAHAGDDGAVVVGRRFQLGDGPVDRERLRYEFSFEALPPVVRGDEREPVLEAFDCELADLETAWHYLWACNASVRRRHLVAAGGFDEAFVGWGLEDSELGYRLTRRGLRLRYAPEAGAYHLHREPVSTARHREWRRNLAYFAGKHDDLVVALQRAFEPAIAPAGPGPGRHECALRFELAARVLAGRHRAAPVG
ncbi:MULTISPECIES: glycosyltransferase [unclassified Streptomyces]|uniref:glycosyltransferase family 2 protein n=1 Tax=unclassified Streptomyces TaxID=2593676 RepID=UPI00037EDC5E|nr:MULTISPECIES: glycosyltransferase [unclassified Streptomyces]MYT27646.1 glycosyltransferase [Streptomyces sp. SID8354]